MAELAIDYERLADSLERGLYDFDKHIPTAASMRLMMPYCDVASFGIAGYVRAIGYDDTRVTVSTPGLDAYPKVIHAVTEVVIDEDNPIIIDSTYRQFMGYVGLGLLPMHQPHYPKQPVLEFRKSNFQLPVDTLMAEIEKLRDKVDQGDVTLLPFSGRYRRTPIEEIQAELTKIWHPANTKLYIPSRQTVKLGKLLASRLTADLL